MNNVKVKPMPKVVLDGNEMPSQALAKYVPEGHSPRIYLQLVTHLLGVDSQGNPRPAEDLLIFLAAARRTGLDPIAKQIYPVYRWDSRLGKEKMTIQAGIDGLRAVAERSKLYAGSDDAQFVTESIYNPITGQEDKDLVARIVIYKINSKTGERMPITASARFRAYAQKGKKKDGTEYYMGMWANDLRYNQLAKCAEALALRKGFPNDLAGIYSEEEMAQATPLADLPAPTPKLPDVKDPAPGKVIPVGESVEPPITTPLTQLSDLRKEIKLEEN